MHPPKDHRTALETRVNLAESIAEISARLKLPELIWDFTTHEINILEGYGTWLRGLTEKTITPLTKKQIAFATIMDDPDPGDDDDYAYAWKKYSAIYYADQLLTFVNRFYLGGKGYDGALDAIWVQGWTANYGIHITEDEKKFFIELPSEETLDDLLWDGNGSPRTVIVQDPERLFGDLLALYRGNVDNLQTCAGQRIRASVVSHVAIFIADKNDPEGTSARTISSPKWFEAYAARNNIPVSNVDHALTLLQSAGSTLSWSRIDGYVVAESNLQAFVDDYLALIERAGNYGRLHIPHILERCANAKRAEQERLDAEAEQQRLDEAERDRDDLLDTSDEDVTPHYGRRPDGEPADEPEDADSYEHLQDAYDPEDPPEMEDDEAEYTS